jgi:hypothetical protein
MKLQILGALEVVNGMNGSITMFIRKTVKILGELLNSIGEIKPRTYKRAIWEL